MLDADPAMLRRSTPRHHEIVKSRMPDASVRRDRRTGRFRRPRVIDWKEAKHASMRRDSPLLELIAKHIVPPDWNFYMRRLGIRHGQGAALP
jgi:hypothetical protein